MFKRLIYLSCLLLIVQVSPAYGATVTATGTNPSQCNQEVDNISGFTAARLANGDCVVQFKLANGSYSWTAPAGVHQVSYLIVGGGGGGGTGYDNAGGGGGAGGMVLTGTKSITPFSNYSVSVGDGGAGGANSRSNNSGSSGSSSSFSNLVALGGGLGNGSRSYPTGIRNGGIAQNSNSASGLGGNGGGAGGGGGGGGGAVGNGGNGSGATRGVGGTGAVSDLTGTSLTFGAGGDGGTSGTTTTGTAGGDNLGKGGAGSGAASSASAAGGKGGSGLVVLRYTLVVATGTNSSLCNQTVSNATSVVASRLSGGDCVIEFKNVGTTTWTVPANLSTAWVLVLAGGGGGGGDEGGGGGGGGYIENSNFSITGGSSISVSVGDGGIAGTDDSAKGGNGGAVTLVSSYRK
jgi:hypothetical protein